MRKAIENETGIDIGADDARTVADLQARIEMGLEDVVPHARLGRSGRRAVQRVRRAQAHPAHVHHRYPLETSPFAKKTPHDPRFVERFEGFIAGMELGNAFSELNDPVDQRERFMQQMQDLADGDETAHRLDEDFSRPWSTACRPPAASAWASTAW